MKIGMETITKLATMWKIWAIRGSSSKKVVTKVIISALKELLKKWKWYCNKVRWIRGPRYSVTDNIVAIAQKVEKIWLFLIQSQLNIVI